MSRWLLVLSRPYRRRHPRRLAGRFALAAGLGICLGFVATIQDVHAADSPRKRDRGQATQVRYDPPASTQSQELLASFRSERYLETAATELDQVMRLPRALTLRMVECEAPNAYYNPDITTILICYNLLPAIAQDLANTELGEERLAQAASHAFGFVLIHELGHALMDILDLAVPGRQEDVADQLSVYALLEEEGGVDAALDGAAWFGVRSHRTDHAPAFWDSHSLDGQRYYNIVCWVYGSNPEALAHLPEQSGLPLSRAVECPRDYQNLKRYWDNALKHVLVKPTR